jgi:hypothetical protein
VQRVILPLVLTLLAAASALPSPRPSAPGPFGGESLFRQPLTLAVRDQPLSEFLGNLRAARKLPVRADRTTQDERITVYCRERPAGEILAAVARHLDYTWVRKTDGGCPAYVLTQMLAARNREKSLRESHLAADYHLLQKRALDHLSDARWTPEERRQRDVEYLTGFRDKLKDPKLREHYDQEIEDVRRGAPGHFARGAEEEALGVALLLMQPPDWERLWKNVLFRFAFPARPGRTAITREQAGAMVRSGIEELTQDITEEGGTLLTGTFAGVDRLHGQVGLGMEDGRPVLRFRCRLVGRQPDFRAHRSLHMTVRPPARPAGTLSSDPIVEPEDKELRQPVEIPPHPEPLEEDRHSTAVLADVLEALAPAVSYTLIGDSYDTGLGFLWVTRGPQRLDAWLRMQLEGGRVQVRRDGAILYFRHQDWARLRRTQVPQRVSQPWEVVLRTRHLLPLRTLCEIAGTLSDEQIPRLLERWYRTRWVTAGQDGLLRSSFGRNVTALRLLSTLTPGEWARLTQPGRPPVLLRRREQTALLLRWFTSSEGDGYFHYEGLNEEPLRRPLEAYLDDEERLEAGATTMCLRGSAQARTFYIGEKTASTHAKDLDDALRTERNVHPKATRESLRRVEGVEYVVELCPDPDAEHPMTSFHFWTAGSD